MSKPKVNEAKLATTATITLTMSFVVSILALFSGWLFFIAEGAVLGVAIATLKKTKQKNTKLQSIIALVVSGFWWGILIFAFVFGFIVGLSGGDIVF